MTYGSKGLAVKTYVKSLIANALPDATVAWGFGDLPVGRVYVDVCNIEWDDSSWGPIGNRARNEAFNVNIWITVTQPGKSGEEVETEAVVAMNTIEAAVRTDAALGGLVIQAALIPKSVYSHPVPNGHVAIAACAVRVSARI